MRWVIISLIMMITIINYLDRGTLNYMWVANVDYELQPTAGSANGDNSAVLLPDGSYRLINSRGEESRLKRKMATPMRVCRREWPLTSVW